ncbi:MAG TPA: IS481 family transposase [Acidimicrobiales bacterium]
MDLAQYAVTAVLVEGRSVRAVAASTGRSKSWVQRHVALYREGGDEALTPRRRGPATALNRTASEIEDVIVAMRKELVDQGYDAGARTIRYHLVALGDAPSLSTIHRVLVRRGFVTPQPQKRPRVTWLRFESDLPNETWQSDMTHWHLRHEVGVEIINYVDDCSRAVLCSKVVKVATSADVVRLFFCTADLYGLPASVLSDNGAIYTASYRESHTGLEIDLATLGIVFKHGKPYHPQTQGKVERYHQTLKKWLRKQPEASSIEELQSQIDGFVRYYNEVRPHQAKGCPPMHVWRALDKATPTLAGQQLLAKTRVRHDRVDDTGAVTLRYRRRLHHISIGRRYKGRRVIILMADLDVRVITDDGELIRHLTLNPTKNYQPRKDD